MALRQALNGSLEEKLDQELIAGTDGLLTGNNLANHAASAVTAFATFLSEFGHGRVDGRFAASLTDVRTVAGAHTYAHMGNQYRSTTADYSALDALDRKTGGVRVSAHVPAVTSHKQNALIRMGQHDRAVVQVLWDGVTLVPDELTKVKTGEVAITAILLVATKILRSASFYKQETQPRAHLDRLVDETGASGVTVLRMTEAQACARVGRLVTGAARLAACEEGIKRRWFGRYQRSANDIEVDP